MMITSQNHGSRNFTGSNSLVECFGKLDTTFCISIQNPRLRTYYQMILHSSLDPTNIIIHLLLNLFRGVRLDFL